MAAAAAAAPGGDAERERRDQPGLEAAERSMCVHKDVSSTTIYVLKPWIVSLLVKDDRLGDHENFLAGQVVEVLSDSAAPGRPGVFRGVSLQVTDGSHYIRVVVSPDALQIKDNSHTRAEGGDFTCKIIVLQKYRVCFQEEARLEDCEFYLKAQKFVMLPIQRQRIESSDGNQEPSVVKKMKELWLRNPAVKNAPSSDPSISQLISAIGHNQLDTLKENAEECLDLRMSLEKPETVTDEVPVTKWEAERKKEQGGDVFMVPVNTLLIPPEEEEAACDSSKADTNKTGKTAPGKSSGDRKVPGDPSVVSQASHAESLALSDSLEGSLDNPWNRIPPLSLTPNSSDEKSFPPDPSLKTQKDVVDDSNTPDLLELCDLDSPKGLQQGEPAQISSPSLLWSYSNPSPVKTNTSQAASALGAACGAEDPEGSRGSQAPLPTLSPDFPVLPSSRLQSVPDRMPPGEQACSSGTAFPADALKPCPVHARTRDQAAGGGKRKLMVEDDQELLAPRGQQQPRGAPRGRGTGRATRSELVSPQGAKKSRKETGLQHRKELEKEEEEEEEEQASSPASGPSSRPERRRALEPYVRKPAQYQYEAPSPELCQQIQSIRISKAMLKWACWILTEEEEEEEDS